MLIGHFYGLRAVAALVGLVVFSAGIGGAVGAWLAGRIFDMTNSYQFAFIIAVVASLISSLIIWKLKKEKVVISE